MAFAVTVAEKRCTRCGIVKPAAEMTRCKAKPDGLMSHCLECKNKENARKRAQSLEPEAVLAREFLLAMARYAA